MKQFKQIVQDQNLNPTNWSPQNFMVWKSAIESLKIKRSNLNSVWSCNFFIFHVEKEDLLIGINPRSIISYTEYHSEFAIFWLYFKNSIKELESIYNAATHAAHTAEDALN